MDAGKGYRVRDASQIESLFRDRKKTFGPIHAAGMLLRSVYNGEHNVVLPELETNERVAVANLVQTGLDQHAMRIASVMPSIVCPAMRGGNEANLRADKRKSVLDAWWYENDIPRMLHLRARHLIGYAMSPVFIRPGKDGYPVWEPLDPLCTFPAPGLPTDITPTDTIVCVKRSLRWLEMRYPREVRRLSRHENDGQDTMFEILQYVDSDQITMVAIGRMDGNGGVSNVTLDTTANRAGRPLIMVPGRITLDKLQGQFDQMIGMYETQAKLWALQLHAIQRGIFPETYVVSKDNGNPPDVTPADPYTGEIGTVAGGVIQEIRTDPSYQNLQALDRLEAGQRMTGAVPAQFGGEGPSNVRTGRAQSMTQSSTIDFPIAEHQMILAASMQEENAAAIDVARTWFPRKSHTFFIPHQRQAITYTAEEAFAETDVQFVEYAYAGSDSNGLVIEGGQRIGMGTLSKKTFMTNDPMVKDADAEGDRIVLEGIQQAALTSIQQQAADPAGPFQPADLARLEELIYDENMPLYKAVQKLHEELQAAQEAAQQGQPPQPGLAMPGAPGTAGAGQPTIGPPPPSMANLTQQLGNLRLQQRQSPGELQSPGG